MSLFGETVTITLFGESHGPAIGAVINGLPAGEEIDEELIAREMARRAPGGSALSTERKEADGVEIVSGLFEGKTTGAPLCGIIRNADMHSRDYSPNLPRPNHADLSAYLKYKGFSDYRGGGPFSGRLTAPIVFAGSVCRQILSRRGISIRAEVLSIGKIEGHGLTPEMEAEILTAKHDLDSVGGVIECTAEGIAPGLGGPYFGSFEAKIASMMFSIPAVQGVEFGAGFAMSTMRGSEANDPIRARGGTFYTETNNCGGINGGITNGMPIVFRVAFKPTPSIAKEQRTVDLTTGEDALLTVRGRHDPCIVPRAVPVVEAGLAVVLLDALMGSQK